MACLLLIFRFVVQLDRTLLHVRWLHFVYCACEGLLALMALLCTPTMDDLVPSAPNPRFPVRSSAEGLGVPAAGIRVLVPDFL